MSVVVSWSDGKRHRGVLFRGVGGKERGGPGEVFNRRAGAIVLGWQRHLKICALNLERIEGGGGATFLPFAGGVKLMPSDCSFYTFHTFVILQFFSV